MYKQRHHSALVLCNSTHIHTHKHARAYHASVCLCICIHICNVLKTTEVSLLYRLYFIATHYTVSRKKPNLENKSDTTDKWTDRHVDKSVLLVQEAASMGDRIPFSRQPNVLIFKSLISQNSPWICRLLKMWTCCCLGKVEILLHTDVASYPTITESSAISLLKPHNSHFRRAEGESSVVSVEQVLSC